MLVTFTTRFIARTVELSRKCQCNMKAPECFDGCPLSCCQKNLWQVKVYLIVIAAVAGSTMKVLRARRAVPPAIETGRVDS